MSIPDCIKAYRTLSDRIFQKKAHRITVRGTIQARFGSEELAKAVKEVVAEQKLPQDALLKDVSDGACKCELASQSLKPI